jgi:hypothetical protein
MKHIQDINVANQVLKARIETEIEFFLKYNPEVEIHEIRVYGYYSAVSKRVEIAIKTDVRPNGEQFLGASS